jgi:choline kinase
VETYQKLKPNDTKVIVSIYTDNINKIKNVIKAVLDQTVKIHSIHVYTSKEEHIPEYLQKIAQVNIVNKKYKKLGNVIPILSSEGDGEVTIISIQDDHIYGIDTFELLLEQSKKDPYKLIYFKNKDYTNGILFKPKFFDIDILDYDGKTSYTDWINNNLKKTGFKTISVKYNDTYKKI